jgi:phage-related protein
MSAAREEPTPKPLVWLHGAIKTPPFSPAARHAAGALLRLLQERELLSLPDSRPMPSIGAHCHELRIPDGERDWRIVYRIDPDAIVVVEVFPKTTRQTPKHVIDTCRRRLSRHDATVKEAAQRATTKRRADHGQSDAQGT